MEEQNKDIIPEGQTQNETPQEDQPVVENSIYTTPDVYQSQTSQDVYKASATEEDYQSMLGVFSGGQLGNAAEEQTAPQADNVVYDNNQYQYGNNTYGNNADGVNQYQYGSNQYGSNQYGNNQYVNSADGTNQYQYGNNQAGSNTDEANQYQYGNNQAGSNTDEANQYQYGNNQYVNNADGTNQYQYGSSQYGNNQYVNSADGTNQYQYGSNQYVNNQAGNNADGTNQYQCGSSQYGNNQYVNNAEGANQYQYGSNQYVNNQAGNQYQYGNNQTGNQYLYGNTQTGNQYQYGNNQTGNPYQYGNQYGYNPNGYNPYSPYATPPKKKSNGVIIGVVIAGVFIFLIALLAIVYNAFKSIYDTASTTADDYSLTSGFIGGGADDDRSSTSGRDSRDDDDNDYKDDDYDSDYDDDEYYEFHDDLKNNLSYSIEWDYFEYELDDEDVSIYVDYPVIVGDDVPNLDKLNARIEREATSFQDYYEDMYSKYMDEDGNSYFYVNATGYVTYMSESVLSIAFQEETQSNYFGAVYVYCINIDMNSGVIMENTDILEVDDDFSVDFRKRSEKQNGVSDSLDSMSDQEITKLLKSEDNLIIFYTPQGMEIGVNYGDGYGWITVTYHDYKKYLKVF
ncbi:MAG: hypothetical protein NC433_06245 [Clostridiales bacterium]|nr:hypothetical protein [Clostridiales bacterium]